MTDASLKSFVDRLENLDAEQKGIGTDKRDVFDEAAAAGYDKKAIRRLLRDRKEAARDKGTAELAEQYRMLLSEPGATYRSVADKTGTKKSTLHRLVPRKENGTEQPHDPATGEITETAARYRPGGNEGTTDNMGIGPGVVPADNSEEEVARVAPPALGAVGSLQGDRVATGEETGSATLVATGNPAALSPNASAGPRTASSTTADDDLKIPDFLRRAPA